MFETDRAPDRPDEGWDPVAHRWAVLRPTDGARPEAAALRPWAASDLDAFVGLLDDPEVWRFLPEPYPAPLDHVLAAELIALSNASDHHVVRAVIVDGQPAGQVRLSVAPGDTARTEAELGYWLGRAYWGRGIAAGVVARFSAQGFAMWPALERQFARVHADNHASRRLLTALGFVSTGDDPAAPGFERLVLQRP